MVNAWKIGIGAGSIILGVYLLFNRGEILSVILGIIAIAIGIGLISNS